MRVFKIGSTRIPEDETMQGLSDEQVRNRLKHAFPEVGAAKIAKHTAPDGTEVVEFKPKAGRKG